MILRLCERLLIAIMMIAFVVSLAIDVNARPAGVFKMSATADFTEEYADAADLERENDPDLGGIMIRLLKQEQSEASPNFGKFVEIARSERGFVVYSPFQASSGDVLVQAKLYPIELSEQNIKAAEMFDVVINEAGEYQRYYIKANPLPLGATREFKIQAQPSRDQSAFVPLE